MKNNDVETIIADIAAIESATHEPGTPVRFKPLSIYGGVHEGNRRAAVSLLIMYLREFTVEPGERPPESLREALRNVLERAHDLRRAIRELRARIEAESTREREEVIT